LAWFELISGAAGSRTAADEAFRACAAADFDCEAG
jgi:hypothetical protein